jgi:hypothetical protein
MLIAADRGDRAAWATHAHFLRTGSTIVVPAVVLAQAWRGGPQPLLSRLLTRCRLEGVSVEDARLAGTASSKARTSDVADALVVVGALRRSDVVMTSDPEDLSHLAAALGGELALEKV